MSGRLLTLEGFAHLGKQKHCASLDVLSSIATHVTSSTIHFEVDPAERSVLATDHVQNPVVTMQHLCIGHVHDYTCCLRLYSCLSCSRICSSCNSLALSGRNPVCVEGSLPIPAICCEADVRLVAGAAPSYKTLLLDKQGKCHSVEQTQTVLHPL